jgi:hypothetical protein
MRKCVMRKYRERAFECLRLANEISNPNDRASLIEMAQAWLSLQQETETNSQQVQRSRSDEDE